MFEIRDAQPAFSDAAVAAHLTLGTLEVEPRTFRVLGKHLPHGKSSPPLLLFRVHSL